MGKTGSCSGGQGLARKALIQLSADRKGCAPSLLVLWPEATHPWGLGSMVALGAISKRVYAKGAFQNCFCQCPIPVVNPCYPTPPQEDLQLQQVVLVQSPVGSLLLSSGSRCTQDFVCTLKDWSLPTVCGNTIIKSYCPSRSDSLEVTSPFVESPG